MVGALVRPLAESPRLLALLALPYALRYGLAETWNTSLRPPSLAWQVPASWVAGRSPLRRVLTWGVLLGPGLVTRNPYAGMWLLPLLVGLNPNLMVAGLVGSCHSAGRAAGVLHNHRLACDPADVAVWNGYRGWRLWDGLLLLVVAGALVGQGLRDIATH